MKYISLILIVFVVTAFCDKALFAQEGNKKIDIENLTLDEMRTLSQDDLLKFSFEDLISLVQKFKLSSVEELYKLLLNPTQSTASKMKEDVFEAPLATTVITSKEIKESGARCIPEVLRLAPGLIVREKTNGNYDVHVRGNDFIPPGSDISNSVNTTTLVLIDNRPVYNNFLGGTFWETIPVALADLDRIEIVYGPSASLYGPNAVTGVINLITKNAKDEGIQTNVQVQGGNHNNQLGYGSLSYLKGKFEADLSVNYQNMDRFQDDYYVPSSGTYVSGSEVGDVNNSTDTTYNASSAETDYWMANQRGALNLNLRYIGSDKFSLQYAGSYQNSSVQTVYMDIGSTISTRESSSFSNMLKLKWGKFDGLVSGVFGHLNAVKGLSGYEYDYQEYNARFGYGFKYKNLTIRPGFDANYSNYSDENYVDNNEGLLNGDAVLGTLQGSLRLDYTAFEKLRVVGAWMQGYFYKPGKAYNAYQFATSYKLNDKSMFRLVAAKSNSSPFVLQTYSNRTSEVGTSNNTSDSVSYFVEGGNEDLDPVQMQMFELGYRQKIGKKVQIDVSVFRNFYDNYSEQKESQQNMAVNDANVYSGGNGSVSSDAESTDVSSGDTLANNANSQLVNYASYENLDLTANQIGFSASVKCILNEKINFSLFATYQHTRLKNYKVDNTTEYEELTGKTFDEGSTDSVYISLDHKYTPALFGGAYINYAPTSKWNLNASVYGYSKQKSFYTSNNEFNWINISSKILCNLKVSYQINDWMQVYVNGRNITNDSSQEFMFADKTGCSYLGGINFRF